MYSQWFKSEHDRLHIIEAWPDSPCKQAALAAVRSAIASLERIASETAPLDCDICLNRRSHGLVAFPGPSPILEDASTELAA